MNEMLETLLDALFKLPTEVQRAVAEKLKKAISEADTIQEETAKSAVQGKLRRHFGAWDSGNVRSADNEEIDRDLSRGCASTRESEA